VKAERTKTIWTQLGLQDPVSVMLSVLKERGTLKCNVWATGSLHLRIGPGEGGAARRGIVASGWNRSASGIKRNEGCSEVDKSQRHLAAFFIFVQLSIARLAAAALE
jgi:hypothetical protein